MVTLDFNLIVAIAVVIFTIVVTAIIAARFGFAAATKLVGVIMSSPVIMAAFSGLEKSAPPEVVTTLLGLLNLGEAVTPNTDLKALLDKLEALIEAAKALPPVAQSATVSVGSTTTTVSAQDIQKALAQFQHNIESAVATSSVPLPPETGSSGEEGKG